MTVEELRNRLRKELRMGEDHWTDEEIAAWVNRAWDSIESRGVEGKYLP